MEELPRDVTNIIEKYARDMHLLEQSPLPGEYTGSITPLNFDIVFGATTLTDLLLANILEAVMDAPPIPDLTSLFVYSKLAEVIDFPLLIINNFERAHNIWVTRCELYGIAESLPPTWSTSLPYMIFEFINMFDVDLLYERLQTWLGAYNITIQETNPFVMLHTLH